MHYVDESATGIELAVPNVTKPASSTSALAGIDGRAYFAEI